MYHPAVCGSDLESVAKSGVEARDAPDMLYVLLVMRALAMGITAEVNPLELREVRWLWGDFVERDEEGEDGAQLTSSRTLPFSFRHSVTLPIHLLSTVLGLNPFMTLPSTEPWILQTMYAKFRATASARMTSDEDDDDGGVGDGEIAMMKKKLYRKAAQPRVDVAAVHWRWCLANHSCAPNVRWEWGVSRKRGGSLIAGTDGDSLGLAGGSPNGDSLGQAGLSPSPSASLNADTLIRGSHESNGTSSLPSRPSESEVKVPPMRGGEMVFTSRERGLRAGEEVMSHYCDIELDVKQRREWMLGTLGGECVCERCVQEIADIERKKGEEGKGGDGEDAGSEDEGDLVNGVKKLEV
jgi:hypothetical protein